MQRRHTSAWRGIYFWLRIWKTAAATVLFHRSMDGHGSDALTIRLWLPGMVHLIENLPQSTKTNCGMVHRIASSHVLKWWILIAKHFFITDNFSNLSLLVMYTFNASSLDNGLQHQPTSYTHPSLGICLVYIVAVLSTSMYQCVTIISISEKPLKACTSPKHVTLKSIW